MLRSLDPVQNYEAPKSKKLRPSAKEAENFSDNELEYIGEAENRDGELKIKRAIQTEQNNLLREKLGLKA